MARHRASFGSVRRLPSGAWQARYTGPDLIRHKAPSTFQTKGDAEAWLALRRSEVLQGKWRPERSSEHVVFTFAEYAERWLENRPLKPRTRDHYRSLLDSRILPAFGTVAVTGITSAFVRDWYARMGSKTPTTRARVRAAARHPGDRRQRRPDRGEPVPHPRRWLDDAGAQDQTSEPGRAGDAGRRYARPVPEHDGARRVVRAAVR